MKVPIQPIYSRIAMAMAIFLLIVSQTIGKAVLDPARHGIVLNQIGYGQTAPKVALLINLQERASIAHLIEQSSGQMATSFTPSVPITDPSSGDSLQSVDFSSVTRAGKYRLHYGNTESVEFEIANYPFEETSRLLLRSYYLQRCGVKLDDPETGIYHPPCHRQDGLMAHSDKFHAANETFSALGGWHDAGDYGKYVATTAVTVGRLLSIHEQFPDAFWDGQLNIPESGNGIPDLLDEMQVGLDWMLHMQRSDGAVYRKLSGQSWPINLTPDEDIQSRYVYGISTSETAKFAGAMAMAARVFRPYNAAQAQAYLSAAKAAWQFLSQHPIMQVDEYADDNDGSGAYLYSQYDQEDTLLIDRDDRLWAAAELFISTGQASYEDYFKEHFETFDYGLFEWKNPAPLGMLDYLQQTQHLSSQPIRNQIRTKILERADRLLAIVHANGYGLANDRFIWGSNKMVAEEGLTLAYAYLLTGNTTYREAAYLQLDYLLGRNPFNQTFITGVGKHSVLNVNHLFARARNLLIPGLVVGGPNADAQDGIAPKDQGILSYIDSPESYATNEYAIDYNAAVAGLITVLANL